MMKLLTKNISYMIMTVIAVVAAIYMCSSTALALSPSNAQALAETNKLAFITGEYGSAESTGNIGAYMPEGPPMDYAAPDIWGDHHVTPEVKWTLKDDTLIYEGYGHIAGGATADRDEVMFPFTDNPHIKVVIVDEFVTNVSFGYLPNLETVIYMDNLYYAGPFVGCPNIKTVIHGANLKNTGLLDVNQFNMSGCSQDTPDVNYYAFYDDGKGNRMKHVTANDFFFRDCPGFVPQDYNKRMSKQAMINELRPVLDSLPQTAKDYLPAEFFKASPNPNPNPNPQPIPPFVPPQHPDIFDLPEGFVTVLTISEWAEDDVFKAHGLNLLPPDKLPADYTQNINRRQFCNLAVRLYENLTNRKITERTYFADNFEEDVEKLAGIGVIHGIGMGKFGLGQNLTREQAATILYRMADLLGIQMDTTGYPFKDIKNSWAVNEIAGINSIGVMNGVSTTAFAPKGDYTIEQSIVTMLRMYNTYKGIA